MPEDNKYVYDVWKMPSGARRRRLLKRYGAPIIGALVACVLLLVLWWQGGGEEQPRNQTGACANDECAKPEPEANQPAPVDDPEPESEPQPFVQPGEEVTLVRIADAGSVIVRADGETFRVMLAAIDAPEVGEPGYSAAVAALKQLATLDASKVTIERDPLLRDRDAYNKPIRYLWVDGVNVNVEMVKQAQARYTGQSKYDAEFRE